MYEFKAYSQKVYAVFGLEYATITLSARMRFFVDVHQT